MHSNISGSLEKQDSDTSDIIYKCRIDSLSISKFPNFYDQKNDDFTFNPYYPDVYKITIKIDTDNCLKDIYDMISQSRQSDIVPYLVFRKDIPVVKPMQLIYYDFDAKGKLNIEGTVILQHVERDMFFIQNTNDIDFYICQKKRVKDFYD